MRDEPVYLLKIQAMRSQHGTPISWLRKFLKVLGRVYHFAVLSVEELRQEMKCDQCGQTVLSDEALYRVPPPAGKPNAKTPRLCRDCAEKADIVAKRKGAA